MSNEELFEKHLGKKNDIKLGDDLFSIKPLGVKYLPHILKVQSGFMSGLSDDMMDKDKVMGIEEVKLLLGGLDDGAMKSMSTLIKDSLVKSYPDMSVDKLEEFGLMHSMELIMHIININTTANHESVKKDKILEELNAPSKPKDKE